MVEPRVEAMMPWLWWFFACSLQPMEPDQPCLEVGYAIASRTLDCSNDGVLANERYEQFAEEFVCIEYDLAAIERPNLENPEKDLFHCAAEIRELECAEVGARGDDLRSWMDVSPACGLVLEPKEGELPEVVADPGEEEVVVECPPSTATEVANVGFTNRGFDTFLVSIIDRASCEEIFFYRVQPAETTVLKMTTGDQVIVRSGNGQFVLQQFVAEPGLWVDL